MPIPRSHAQTEKKGRTHNRGLGKVRVQCSVDTFVVTQSLVLCINPKSFGIV